MSLSASVFRWHRWFGWLIGAQVLVWVVGGLVFSIVPFQAWVKGGDSVAPPPLALPAGWADRTAEALRTAARDGASTIATAATPHGPVLKLQWKDRRPPLLIRADGEAWTPPTADEVRRFARAHHRHDAPILTVERLGEVPKRLLIVSEVGTRRDLWRVRFDDGLGTRLYFRGDTGEFLTARNEAWVWYDFFWRLHIMDYTEGEDFNGTLLRVSAVAAFVLVSAGSVLAVLAIRRRWRRRVAQA